VRSAAAAPAPETASFAGVVRSDALEWYRSRIEGGVTTRDDAAGACDGVKSGKWGFHTDTEANPWWQVDLGLREELSHVLVWGRTDADFSDRRRELQLLVSEDGTDWTRVYRHDGTRFGGVADNAPLRIALDGVPARYVRIQILQNVPMHLDEVEVFPSRAPETNIAVGCEADQSSTSPWSVRHLQDRPALPWRDLTADVLDRCDGLLRSVAAASERRQEWRGVLADLRGRLAGLQGTGDATLEQLLFEARDFQRQLTLSQDVLLGTDAILFVRRVPGTYSHMSDQYLGWWSRPGGDIAVLTDFRTEDPRVTSLTAGLFPEGGSFLRPDLSWDGTRILFSWCRHYPHLAGHPDKFDKGHIPEDAFYQIYEMELVGGVLRRLTTGKYDHIDPRYLPDGRVVFLSTRRGRFVRVNRETAMATVLDPEVGDCYVRCGGGPQRPCAVYTLHTMAGDGTDLSPISPFEMFEWHPSVAADGTILYSRWDYVDRDNMPYMSLWQTNPDGTRARLVYGNFTTAPHCIFEPRSIPGSRRIVFTASGHHAQTMGSLALLDPRLGTEGQAPVTRLTPEVVFPEIEGWPQTFYANPWPLSERFHLTAWGREPQASEGTQRTPGAMGIYVFDATGNLELLHREPGVSAMTPIPLRPRQCPPRIPDTTDHSPQAGHGVFVVTNVYEGLKGAGPGPITALRLVAVPVKTHPTMNLPSLGLTADDPGKCILGTVPVEADGSAHFLAPAGVPLFFQALDGNGRAVQTMRSATCVQPGERTSCIGCHESRMKAPPGRPPAAMSREASRIQPGPPGSWPLRYDVLVQPVLDRLCVACHSPGGEGEKVDLTPEKSYATLTSAANPSLAHHVRTRYAEGKSTAGACGAATSPVLAQFAVPGAHHGVVLDGDARERLTVWMDTYAQRLGSFDAQQEEELRRLRQEWSSLLTSGSSE
jgi:hypothetical protein